MNPDKAKQKILSNIHPGEVMLLHPTSETNAQVLGEVIDECRRMGYRFGTLDELTARA
jgi:peptidoglycan-N-acetylmuramic acid deacetylase